DVPWLAGIEAVEDLDLHPGEEMRQVVAGREYRLRVPVAYAGDIQQPLALDQVRSTRAVEEPGGLAATRADGFLHRAQDRQRITLRSVHQEARGCAHRSPHRSSPCLSSTVRACSMESGLHCIS